MAPIKFHLTIGLLTLLALLTTNQVLAGGSLVGTGGGLVEQNIFFAYRALPKTIDACLDSIVPCGLTISEQSLLKKIRVIVIAHPASIERLQFVTEKDYPGFFKTAPGEAHRTARTELDPKAPIFFNRDQLYTLRGLPALDFLEISGLLIHELGHQALETDHAALDLLAVKIRLQMQPQVTHLPYRDENLETSVTIINYSTTHNAVAELYINDNKDLHSIGGLLPVEANCPSAEEIALSWQLENVHWKQAARLATIGKTSLLQLPLGAWLTIQCVSQSKMPARFNIVRKPIEFNLWFLKNFGKGDTSFKYLKSVLLRR
ncbi:MAG: hypothetical protein H7061_01030 [Bdellovibrionaceae bacterium]|nr:hypothetical protein [Bdellovibrio sp.]